VTRVEADGEILFVTVATPGDFSRYVLRLVASPADDRPPDGIDPALADVEFSFKADCPSDFDCRVEHTCTPPRATAPAIDYLARDYTTFRRVILDRLSTLLPSWQERSAADLWVALSELIAFRADELTYFQDAVATEAYLGTARLRSSVRRHARLLDYAFHDGSNARAWVAFDVDAGADGLVLPGCDPETGLDGTRLLSATSGLGANVDLARARLALDAGTQAFETLHDVTLYRAHNAISFYTWSDEECCLPKGATRAWLRDDALARLRLRPGDVLIFEERVSPSTGLAEDADRTHRHAVRLTHVDPAASVNADGTRTVPALRTDPLTRDGIVEIAWHTRDALPFSLCLSTRIEGRIVGDVALACGNVVLADHGRTVPDESIGAVSSTSADAGERLEDVGDRKRYRPRLGRTITHPVTQQARSRHAETGALQLVDTTQPAASAFTWDMADVRPVVELRDDELRRWTSARDLLASDRFATEFVVEIEEDNRATLRFGDDVAGVRPKAGDRFTARYRIGNGTLGNVGAEAIAHVVGVTGGGILRVRNPLPGSGGREPHALWQARLYAPQAFRQQERAVTPDDYAAMAQRHPDVQRAVATRRWTGSWHTLFITVDRRNGLAVDAAFERELVQFLERYRLAGHDVEIDAPRFVSLDVALDICAHPGHFAPDVLRRLIDAFSPRVLASGTGGFFHPDNFTFGGPVYLSAVMAHAMRVPGVRSVVPRRFQRLGRTAGTELADGVMRMGRLEIARLDNDPNAPEHGRLDIVVAGGA
jgi:hypothetical protein